MNIKVYQINSERDTENYAFLNHQQMSDLRGDPNPDSSIYNCVFDGEVTVETLDEIFSSFNENRPDDFNGRPIQKSDVIEIIESETVEKGFYYVDSIGFQKVDFETDKVGTRTPNTLRVLYVEPGKLARITEIGKDLESMQEAVGGDIQAIYPFEDTVALVCNDDGKCMGMPANRALYMEGEMVDILCGPFFICDAPANSESFKSLSDEQLKNYMEKFKRPERFYKVGDTITAIPYTPRDKESR